MKEIKFQVFDTVEKKVIPSMGTYLVGIYTKEDVVAAEANREGLILREFVGVTDAGENVFDGDIVEVKDGDERITDLVHWEDCAWRFGEYDGTLASFQILKVVGNIYANPWPTPVV